MASPIVNFRNFIAWIFVRFPFLNAITLLMLLAERAEKDEYPFIDPTLIYGHVGALLLIGICMTGKFSKREIACVYCLQIMFLSYSMYTSESSKYQEWQKIRICLRPLGVIGINLIYAEMSERRNSQFLRLGHTIVGIYFSALAFMLLNFKIDQRAFYTHFAHYEILLYLVVGALVISAVPFFHGRWVVDCAAGAGVLMLFLTIIMETGLTFWRRQGMELWNQLRILSDSICVIMGLLLVATSEMVAVTDAKAGMRFRTSKAQKNGTKTAAKKSNQKSGLETGTDKTEGQTQSKKND